MSRLWAFISFAICFCGCVQNADQLGKGIWISSRSAKEAIQYINWFVKNNSFYRLRMKGIDEPHIDTFKSEVFRFYYTHPFDGSVTITAEQHHDSSFQLTYKYIEFDLPLFRPLRKLWAQGCKTVKDYYGNDSLIVYTENQQLNKFEGRRFREILNESHYWMFENLPSCDSGSHWGNLSLISKSIWPKSRGDTLRFHVNSIHCPFKGSYTEAYNYLAKKSRLFKELGLRATVRNH